MSTVNKEIYELFLNRLKEIREYEWNDNSIMIYSEEYDHKGIRKGESTLDGIARHMTEVLDQYLSELHTKVGLSNIDDYLENFNEPSLQEYINERE